MLHVRTHYADLLAKAGERYRRTHVTLKEGSRTLLDADVSVPQHWSDHAARILAHKYLRKAGVPRETQPNASYAHNIPVALCPRVALASPTQSFGAETSAQQVFHRLAGHWAYTALCEGYMGVDDALRYYAEMYAMLYYQVAAPNSPQFFNTGLWWAYGIAGDDSGAYVAHPGLTNAVRVQTAYRFPQTSACFILGLQDSLLGDGGILDTLKEEARIFKYGSGSGVNYSALRAKGAPLSNGGHASGLLSFLDIFDTNAGAIKSGGTTRRAARMVIVDADHPEAEEFVVWKQREEAKVQALVLGANTASTPPSKVQADVLSELKTAAYEGTAYQTVGGQNANNSLRVTHAFMQQVLAPEDDPRNTARDKQLWSKTVEAAWSCGDPGIQFHTTINHWHTCPKAGPIRASNPCSEYMFIDNSACNLASINLAHDSFRTPENLFKSDLFEHVVRLWTITLDVTIAMSSFPNAAIAENSARFRTLGLGYCNLGGLLMLLGLPYASPVARSLAASLTSLMHAAAWQTSMEMAQDSDIGPMHDIDTHIGDIAKVFCMHRDANATLTCDGKWGHILSTATALWEEMYTQDVGRVRNAQLTLLAPTGTISFIMDAATTGIEPEFALTKKKKLAGGGAMQIANPLIGAALSSLGYDERQRGAILADVEARGVVDKLTPEIEVAHIPIFACANDIDWRDHILMMAAVQPFLSGAISKTVNMPATATREDVASAFRMAWVKGLKAITIYRDGCKLSQPLTAAKLAAPVVTTSSEGQWLSEASLGKSLRTQQPRKTTRYKLPSRRRGFRQKVNVGGHNIYVSTGEYEDGTLGEIFLTISKEGSTLKHFMDALAMSVSIGLQYGVPLEEYLEAFIGARAEPSGVVIGSEHVKMCNSPIDYVFREIQAAYGKGAGITQAAEAQPASAPVAPSMEEFAASVDAEDGGGVVQPLFVRRTAAAVVMERVVVKYAGDPCRGCGAFTLRANGSCKVCDTCGETTGCS